MNKRFFLDSKLLLIASCFFIVALCASASVPAGYYSFINGKSGEALKDAIHKIIRNHTVLSYNSMWSYFPSTDAIPGTNRVWDMYSNNTYYYAGNGRAVGGMNIEHSFPKSWWGGSKVEAYTDLNHLYPSDGKANTAKNNYPLGVVSTADFDNGVSKIGYPVAGQGGGCKYVFEPADEYKGDFARTYFYMATCYQDYTFKYTYMVNNSSYLTLNTWAYELLLKWSREDPVSDKEIKRNEAVFKTQNNRNPFIDNPELAEYIWGNKKGKVYNPGSTPDPNPDPTPDDDPILITPTQDTELDFGEVAIGKSLDYTLYVKGKYLTNDLSVQVYRYDYSMFKSSVTSIPREIATTDDGYKLTLTYTPTAIGSHKAKLLILDGGLVGSVGVNLKATCRPVPSLSAVKALPAVNITGSSYVATWQPSTDTIDYYIVNRIVYDAKHAIVSNEQFETDETSYEFSDMKPGQTHTYTVQACRLGYTSVASNVITVEYSGVSGVQASKPFAIAPATGGVRIVCSEPLSNVRIYRPNGQLVKSLPSAANDQVIELADGVYVLTSSSSTQPAKIIVK